MSILPLSVPRQPDLVNLCFGQAYPDVSAQSENFLISLQGNATFIGGTSAAAPTFAGIITLLNDAQLAANKPSLGFLNPMLYTMGGAGLNDIVAGNAPGCGTPGFYVRLLLSVAALTCGSHDVTLT